MGVRPGWRGFLRAHAATTKGFTMTNQAPTVGRIVHYTLSAADAAAISHKRSGRKFAGNTTREGDVVPLIIVRVWPDGVNGQAILDGDDSHWVTSRREGDEPGTWAWPPRV